MSHFVRLALMVLGLSFVVPSLASQVNIDKILASAPGLSRQALDTALNGYQYAIAHDAIAKPGLLTVIDFDLPSSDKRLWLIDLSQNKVLMNLRTTQGRNSGLFQATRFSNVPRSYESSLGVYKTLKPYYGEHGFSLRLQGLEPGVNNNARERDIVVHPAWYVSKNFVDTYHRTGRSLGCFALAPKKSKAYIDLAQNGTVIFAYAKPELNDPIIA